MPLFNSTILSGLFPEGNCGPICLESDTQWHQGLQRKTFSAEIRAKSIVFLHCVERQLPAQVPLLEEARIPLCLAPQKEGTRHKRTMYQKPGWTHAEG